MVVSSKRLGVDAYVAPLEDQHFGFLRRDTYPMKLVVNENVLLTTPSRAVDTLLHELYHYAEYQNKIKWPHIVLHRSAARVVNRVWSQVRRGGKYARDELLARVRDAIDEVVRAHNVQLTEGELNALAAFTVDEAFPVMAVFERKVGLR